jgi:energy-coupling factor transport system substrate-specific component
MLGAGWMGLAAGWLPSMRRWPRAELLALAVYGAVWGLIYGVILNLWFWPFLAPTGLAETDGLYWVPGMAWHETVRRYALFYLVTSFAYDLTRSAATVGLMLALGRSLLVVLRRFQRRFTWEPVEITTSPATVIPGDTIQQPR